MASVITATVEPSAKARADCLAEIQRLLTAFERHRRPEDEAELELELRFLCRLLRGGDRADEA
jgi:hypothetical protein